MKCILGTQTKTADPGDAFSYEASLHACASKSSKVREKLTLRLLDMIIELVLEIVRVLFFLMSLTVLLPRTITPLSVTFKPSLAVISSPSVSTSAPSLRKWNQLYLTHLKSHTCEMSTPDSVKRKLVTCNYKIYSSASRTSDVPPWRRHA